MSTKKLRTVLESDVGPTTFGLFIRVARHSLGLSQVEMARTLGVSKGTLCDIEKGRQLVSPQLAVKVAKKAGLSEKLAVQACLQDQVNKVKLGLTVKLVA